MDGWTIFVVAIIILWIASRFKQLRMEPPTPGTSTHSDEAEILELRQNLRRKVLHDEEKIDRLIEAERKRTPNASLIHLMRSAIERWERDNQ
jgi:hypothetical protein